MFDQSFLEEIQSNLMKMRGNFKEVYIENFNRFLFTNCKDEIKILPFFKTGLGIRVERGSSMIFKKKQSSDLNNLFHFLKYFDDLNIREDKTMVEKKFVSREKNYILSMEEITHLQKGLKSLLVQNGEYGEITPAVNVNRKCWAVINSEGVLVNEKQDYWTIYFSVEKKGGVGAESIILYGKREINEIKEYAKKVLEEAYKTLVFRKTATNKIKGRIPVVFSSRASGFLFNEALSHFFEADLDHKTNFSKLIGEKIASQDITLSDIGPEPSYARCDNEGYEPLKPTVLIENGRIVNLLTNRQSAKSLSLKRTGNGIRSNFRCHPVVGSWNIHLMPSKYDEMELVESVDFGLYVKRLEDGYLSLKKGTFSFPVTESYIIRNGKISESVKNIAISGKTPQFLNDIKLMGNKAETYKGLRKKGEQFLRTSETVPPILIKEILVNPVK